MNRYLTRIWLWLWIILLAFSALLFKSEIRDLQRRVGQLEQQVRR